MIPRRLTVFCKLVIVFFVMGFNKNFKVRVLKFRLMKSIKKLGEYEYSEACERAMKIGLFLVVMKFADILTVRS